jgi:hypothetical protein
MLSMQIPRSVVPWFRGAVAGARVPYSHHLIPCVAGVKTPLLPNLTGVTAIDLL